MAPIFKSLALAGALFMASTSAAPVEKRAVVWETVTDVVYTTVDVTTTLYPQELVATATVVPVTTTSSDVAVAETTPVEETTPAAKAEEHRKPEPTTTSTSTSTPAPAPEPTEEPTTSAAPAPAPVTTEPTTTEEPTSTSSAVAAPTSSASSSDSGSSSSGYSGTCSKDSPCSGQMTYYDTATSASAPSACGTTNDGLTELVLALPVGIMTDSDCGKTVTIEYGGVTKTGTVVDKCMGCDNGSLDLSRAFFEVFDSLSAGRVSGAKWYIN